MLEAFPDALFNIDIKGAGAAAALADLIREHDLWDRVLVGSFSPARIREFRRLTEGRIPTAAHPWEILAFGFCRAPALPLGSPGVISPRSRSRTGGSGFAS